MSSKWLNDFRNDVYSQNGEDGVLQTIFQRIGIHDAWCCEFGAWDGIQFSNTRNLILQGWSGVLIESDPLRFQDLYRNCVGLHSVVYAMNETVRPDTFESILAKTSLPKHFDLLSIDVDGPDYSIWEALRPFAYTPRVVIFEVDSGFPPGVHDTPPNGASIEMAVAMAKRKGYELALHTGNAIFVRAEYIQLLDIEPNNWQELFDRSQVRQAYL